MNPTPGPQSNLTKGPPGLPHPRESLNKNPPGGVSTGRAHEVAKSNPHAGIPLLPAGQPFARQRTGGARRRPLSSAGRLVRPRAQIQGPPLPGEQA